MQLYTHPSPLPSLAAWLFLPLFLTLCWTLIMKIATIEYFRVLPRWLFVKIVDEEGHYGWGEATLEGHTLAVEGCLDSLRQRFVGYEAE